MKLLLVTIVAGGILAEASAAFACSCADPGPPCRALLQTDSAFVGQVLRISAQAASLKGEDLPHSFRRVHFRVEENFRGAGVERGEELEVLSGFGGGDCGYEFIVGERYVVYAQHFPSSKWLYTGICSRTRKLADAATDLDYLRTRNRPERAAGIEGSINELSRDPRTKETRLIGPMRGVTVMVEDEGDGKRWHAKTDERGWFRVWGLTFGMYRVRAELSKKFIPDATIRDHVIVESGVCGWVHMLATPWP